MTDYCERCDDLGITRWVTDEIWCNVHYQIWLMEAPGEDYPADPADQPKWDRLQQVIANRAATTTSAWRRAERQRRQMDR